jgi:hypothetical protein
VLRGDTYFLDQAVECWLDWAITLIRIEVLCRLLNIIVPCRL